MKIICKTVELYKSSKLKCWVARKRQYSCREQIEILDGNFTSTQYNFLKHLTCLSKGQIKVRSGRGKTISAGMRPYMVITESRYTFFKLITSSFCIVIYKANERGQWVSGQGASSLLTQSQMWQLEFSLRLTVGLNLLGFGRTHVTLRPG